jgi:RNA polymerase-associated protein
MTLFSGDDVFSHRVRMVLAEKGINYEIVLVDESKPHEDLLALNPYHNVPTLVDRDLILYDSQVIMEYLDERFPHPPLMPVDPVNRAKLKMIAYRIRNDWDVLIEKLKGKTEKQGVKQRKELRESLAEVSDFFIETPYFFHNELTLLDCMLIPLLWRLPQLNIELPSTAQPMIDYMERLFKRESFQMSLTELEREINE